MSATAVCPDTKWLQTPHYNVMALNPKLAERVFEVKLGLHSGLAAYPDLNRQDFYDVELPNGWAYIHVRDDSRIVYLVAYSPG